MVRETRHLWVGNLPDNIREERILEHFKRYGRVQSVKLLAKKEDEVGLCATVAFIDIKSASKAHSSDNKIDERTLKTDYYEPPTSSMAGAAIHIHERDDALLRTTSALYTASRTQRYPHGLSEDRGYERSSHYLERPPERDSSYVRRQTSYHNDDDVYRGRGRTRERSSNYRGVATQGFQSPLESRHLSLIPGLARGVLALPSLRVRVATRGAAVVVVRAAILVPKGALGPNLRGISVSYSSRGSSKASRPPGERGCGGGASPVPSLQSAVTVAVIPSAQITTTAISCNTVTSGDSDLSSTPATVDKEDKRPLGICVRNLPVRSSDTSLKDGLFHEYKKHGKVTTVKVIGQGTDRYAVVCFKKPEDVEKALEVSKDKLFFGSKIEVTSHEGLDVEDNEFRPLEAELDEFHPKATRTLFIGNLEKDITTAELRKHFEQFGEIIEIDIKKQGAVSSYAFVQYSDIASVVKAMRKMDGEHLGANRIKLGFGKSMPTNCVWLDGIADTVSDKFLARQFVRFGHVVSTYIDRERGHALIFYERVEHAQIAVPEMRGRALGGKKLQVGIDFASRECQMAFFEKLEMSGQMLPGDRPWDRRDQSFDNREERYNRDPRLMYDASSRGFTRFDSQTRASRTNFRGSQRGTFASRGRGQGICNRSFDEEFSQTTGSVYEDSYEQELREYGFSQRERRDYSAEDHGSRSFSPRRRRDDCSLSPKDRLSDGMGTSPHPRGDRSSTRYDSGREDDPAVDADKRTKFFDQEKAASRKIRHRSVSDQESYHSQSPPNSRPQSRSISPPMAKDKRLKDWTTRNRSRSPGTPIQSPSREGSVDNNTAEHNRDTAKRRLSEGSRDSVVVRTDFGGEVTESGVRARTKPEVERCKLRKVHPDEDCGDRRNCDTNSVLIKDHANASLVGIRYTDLAKLSNVIGLNTRVQKTSADIHSVQECGKTIVKDEVENDHESGELVEESGVTADKDIMPTGVDLKNLQKEKVHLLHLLEKLNDTGAPGIVEENCVGIDKRSLKTARLNSESEKEFVNNATHPQNSSESNDIFNKIIDTDCGVYRKMEVNRLAVDHLRRADTKNKLFVAASGKLSELNEDSIKRQNSPKDVFAINSAHKRRKAVSVCYGNENPSFHRYPVQGKQLSADDAPLRLAVNDDEDPTANDKIHDAGLLKSPESKPGTPLVDEPRREKESPLSLPLPRFATSVSMSSPKHSPKAVSSPKLTCAKSPLLSPPGISQGSAKEILPIVEADRTAFLPEKKVPIPCSVEISRRKSNLLSPPAFNASAKALVPDEVSDSEQSSKTRPLSPSIEERIRILDERYRQWSGSTRNTDSSLPAASTEGSKTTDAEWTLKRRPSFLNADITQLRTEPSDIVKSLLAKSSIFDQDSKRLEHINEKYEPRQVPIDNMPKKAFCFRTKAAAKEFSASTLPPVVTSPLSSFSTCTIKYPFPTTPNVASSSLPVYNSSPIPVVNSPSATCPPPPVAVTSPKTTILSVPVSTPVPAPIFHQRKLSVDQQPKGGSVKTESPVATAYSPTPFATSVISTTVAKPAVATVTNSPLMSCSSNPNVTNAAQATPKKELAPMMPSRKDSISSGNRKEVVVKKENSLKEGATLIKELVKKESMINNCTREIRKEVQANSLPAKETPSRRDSAGTKEVVFKRDNIAGAGSASKECTVKKDNVKESEKRESSLSSHKRRLVSADGYDNAGSETNRTNMKSDIKERSKSESSTKSFEPEAKKLKLSALILEEKKKSEHSSSPAPLKRPSKSPLTHEKKLLKLSADYKDKKPEVKLDEKSNRNKDEKKVTVQKTVKDAKHDRNRVKSVSSDPRIRDRDKRKDKKKDRKDRDEKKSDREEKKPDREEKKSDREEKKPDREEKKPDREEKKPDREEKKSDREEKKLDRDEKKSDKDKREDKDKDKSRERRNSEKLTAKQEKKQLEKAFSFWDEEPVYFSMYDKVKARSSQNEKAKEKEKELESMREKFNQLKQSRAKKEEKVRPSLESDSDNKCSDVGSVVSSDNGESKTSTSAKAKQQTKKRKLIIASDSEDSEANAGKSHMRVEKESDMDDDSDIEMKVKMNRRRRNSDGDSSDTDLLMKPAKEIKKYKPKSRKKYDKESKVKAKSKSGEDTSETEGSARTTMLNLKKERKRKSQQQKMVLVEKEKNREQHEEMTSKPKKSTSKKENKKKEHTKEVLADVETSDEELFDKIRSSKIARSKKSMRPKNKPSGKSNSNSNATSNANSNTNSNTNSRDSEIKCNFHISPELQNVKIEEKSVASSSGPFNEDSVSNLEMEKPKMSYVSDCERMEESTQLEIPDNDPKPEEMAQSPQNEIPSWTECANEADDEAVIERNDFTAAIHQRDDFSAAIHQRDDIPAAILQRDDFPAAVIQREDFAVAHAGSTAELHIKDEKKHKKSKKSTNKEKKKKSKVEDIVVKIEDTFPSMEKSSELSLEDNVPNEEEHVESVQSRELSSLIPDSAELVEAVRVLESMNNIRDDVRRSDSPLPSLVNDSALDEDSDDAFNRLVVDESRLMDDDKPEADQEDAESHRQKALDVFEFTDDELTDVPVKFGRDEHRRQRPQDEDSDNKTKIVKVQQMDEFEQKSLESIGIHDTEELEQPDEKMPLNAPEFSPSASLMISTLEMDSDKEQPGKCESEDNFEVQLQATDVPKVDEESESVVKTHFAISQEETEDAVKALLQATFGFETEAALMDEEQEQTDSAPKLEPVAEIEPVNDLHKIEEGEIIQDVNIEKEKQSTNDAETEEAVHNLTVTEIDSQNLDEPTSITTEVPKAEAVIKNVVEALPSQPLTPPDIQNDHQHITSEIAKQLLPEEIEQPDAIESNKTKVNIVKPEVEIAKPEVEIAKPEVEIAKPEVEIAKPEVEIAKTEVETLKTEVVAVNTEVDIVKPETDSVESEVIDPIILPKVVAVAEHTLQLPSVIVPPPLPPPPPPPPSPPPEIEKPEEKENEALVQHIVTPTMPILDAETNPTGISGVIMEVKARKSRKGKSKRYVCDDSREKVAEMENEVLPKLNGKRIKKTPQPDFESVDVRVNIEMPLLEDHAREFCSRKLSEEVPVNPIKEETVNLLSTTVIEEKLPEPKVEIPPVLPPVLEPTDIKEAAAVENVTMNVVEKFFSAANVEKDLTMAMPLVMAQTVHRQIDVDERKKQRRGRKKKSDTLLISSSPPTLEKIGDVKGEDGLLDEKRVEPIGLRIVENKVRETVKENRFDVFEFRDDEDDDVTSFESSKERKNEEVKYGEVRFHHDERKVFHSVEPEMPVKEEIEKFIPDIVVKDEKVERTRPRLILTIKSPHKDSHDKVAKVETREEPAVRIIEHRVEDHVSLAGGASLRGDCSLNVSSCRSSPATRKSQRLQEKSYRTTIDEVIEDVVKGHFRHSEDLDGIAFGGRNGRRTRSRGRLEDQFAHPSDRYDSALPSLHQTVSLSKNADDLDAGNAETGLSTQEGVADIDSFKSSAEFEVSRTVSLRTFRITRTHTKSESKYHRTETSVMQENQHHIVDQDGQEGEMMADGIVDAEKMETADLRAHQSPENYSELKIKVSSKNGKEKASNGEKSVVLQPQVVMKVELPKVSQPITAKVSGDKDGTDKDVDTSPTALVDPVTGFLTPVRQSEEGTYIPATTTATVTTTTSTTTTVVSQSRVQMPKEVTVESSSVKPALNVLPTSRLPVVVTSKPFLQPPSLTSTIQVAGSPQPLLQLVPPTKPQISVTTNIVPPLIKEEIEIPPPLISTLRSQSVPKSSISENTLDATVRNRTQSASVPLSSQSDHESRIVHPSISARTQMQIGQPMPGLPHSWPYSSPMANQQHHPPLPPPPLAHKNLSHITTSSYQSGCKPNMSVTVMPSTKTSPSVSGAVIGMPPVATTTNIVKLTTTTCSKMPILTGGRSSEVLSSNARPAVTDSSTFYKTESSTNSSCKPLSRISELVSEQQRTIGAGNGPDLMLQSRSSSEVAATSRIASVKSQVPASSPKPSSLQMRQSPVILQPASYPMPTYEAALHASSHAYGSAGAGGGGIADLLQSPSYLIQQHKEYLSSHHASGQLIERVPSQLVRPGTPVAVHPEVAARLGNPTPPHTPTPPTHPSITAQADMMHIRHPNQPLVVHPHHPSHLNMRHAPDLPAAYMHQQLVFASHPHYASVLHPELRAQQSVTLQGMQARIPYPVGSARHSTESRPSGDGKSEGKDVKLVKEEKITEQHRREERTAATEQLIPSRASTALGQPAVRQPQAQYPHVIPSLRQVSPHLALSPHDRTTDSPTVANVYNQPPRLRYHNAGSEQSKIVAEIRVPHDNSDNVHSRQLAQPSTMYLEPRSEISASMSSLTKQELHRSSLKQSARSPCMRPQTPPPAHARSVTNYLQPGCDITPTPQPGSEAPLHPASHVISQQMVQPRSQLQTPPHASQVPPQGDSLLMLLQRYPVMWQGLLALKNDQAAVQMHFVSGNHHVAISSLPSMSEGGTPPLRIAQRMRLEQTQLEGVARRMQMEGEHCMLLALPCGRDHMDVLQQSNNLRNGFITYLQQKQAAGIVNVAIPGSQQPAYVVHIFPACDFSNDNLARIAPDLLHSVADIAHLLIVIATV
uniref:Msx2-interacting protein n=1 Tax=Strigamia maritima TaxID=126957 RepID=T1J4C3_STRMM